MCKAGCPEQRNQRLAVHFQCNAFINDVLGELAGPHKCQNLFLDLRVLPLCVTQGLGCKSDMFPSVYVLLQEDSSKSIGCSICRDLGSIQIWHVHVLIVADLSHSLTPTLLAEMSFAFTLMALLSRVCVPATSGALVANGWCSDQKWFRGSAYKARFQPVFFFIKILTVLSFLILA